MPAEKSNKGDATAPKGSKTRGKGETGKTRQFHTRSRAGCVVCRARHVRCDETRPSCKNCASANRTCEYTPARIPLRERRAQERQPLQPGEQKPWICWELHAGSSTMMPTASAPSSPTPWQVLSGCTSVDPFDTMAVDMRYRSKELFNYFCDMGGYLGKEQHVHSLRSIINDPASLRNTLILAGLHYAWNRGTLDEFESTFLYHKIESIRTVNQYLQELKSETATACIRQISTLSFAEYCFGNEEAAEAHLQAIASVFNLTPDTQCRRDIDEEFVNRYTIVSYYFLLGFKEKAEDVPSEPHHLHRSAAEEAACLKSLQSRTGENRLRVLHLLPTFLSGPESCDGLRDVTADAIIDGLREATSDCDQRQVDKLLNSPCSMQAERVTCAMRRHFMAMTCRVLSAADNTVKVVDMIKKKSTRAAKLPPSPPSSSSSSPSSGVKLVPQRPKISSLTGIGTAAALYLHSVLENYNSGYPVDMRLHLAVLSILQRDLSHCEYRNLEQTVVDEGGIAMNRDFWFWRAFVGSLSLSKAMEVALATAAAALDPNTEAESQAIVDNLSSLQLSFDKLIRRWSEVSGVTDWRDARDALARIVWPEFEPSETLAERLWERAVGWPYSVSELLGEPLGGEEALFLDFDSLYD